MATKQPDYGSTGSTESSNEHRPPSATPQKRRKVKAPRSKNPVSTGSPEHTLTVAQTDDNISTTSKISAFVAQPVFSDESVDLNSNKSPGPSAANNNVEASTGGVRRVYTPALDDMRRSSSEPSGQPADLTEQPSNDTLRPIEKLYGRIAKLLLRILLLLLIIGSLVYLIVYKSSPEVVWQAKTIDKGVNEIEFMPNSSSDQFTIHIFGHIEKTAQNSTPDMTITYPDYIDCYTNKLNLTIRKETPVPKRVSQYCLYKPPKTPKKLLLSMKLIINSTINQSTTLVVQIDEDRGSQFLYFICVAVLVVLCRVILMFAWIDKFLTVSCAICVGLCIHHFYAPDDISKYYNHVMSGAHDSILQSDSSNTLLLIIGLFIINGEICKTGVYQAAAKWIASRFGERTNWLYVVMSIFSMIFSSAFGSIPSVILLTRLIVCICSEARLVTQIVMIPITVFIHYGSIFDISSIIELAHHLRGCKSNVCAVWSMDIVLKLVPGAVLILLVSLVILYLILLRGENPEYKHTQTKGFIQGTIAVAIAEKIEDDIMVTITAQDKVKERLRTYGQEVKRALRQSQNRVVRSDNSDPSESDESFTNGAPTTSTSIEPLNQIRVVFVISILLIVLSCIQVVPWIDSAQLSPGMVSLFGAVAVLVFSDNVQTQITNINWNTIAFLMLFDLFSQIVSSVHGFDLLAIPAVEIGRVSSTGKTILLILYNYVMVYVFSGVSGENLLRLTEVALYDLYAGDIIMVLTVRLASTIGLSSLIYSSYTSIIMKGELEDMGYKISPLQYLKYSMPLTFSSGLCLLVYLFAIVKWVYPFSYE